MGFLDDMRVHIEASTALVGGTDLFGGFLPPDPDTAVGIFQLDGLPPLRSMGSGLPFVRRPRLQVRSRSASYATSLANVETIYAALEPVVNTTINGVSYLRIEAMSEPIDMGEDKSNRQRFDCYFVAWRAG